ncbi:glycoside hydrolase family 3 protein [Hypoxylon sp. EC38]|nr:glycoside hydrolase family 3 protein [Hypoxylon sp. EC38]
MRSSFLWFIPSAFALLEAQAGELTPEEGSLERHTGRALPLDKVSYIDALVSNMTVEDLVLQLHLMFAGDIVGVESKNELYDYTMRFSPDSPIGVMHDW